MPMEWVLRVWKNGGRGGVSSDSSLTLRASSSIRDFNVGKSEEKFF